MMWKVETVRGESVPIEDLNRSATRTEPLVISDAEKKKSLCLDQLCRMGVLKISEIIKTEENRRPAAPKNTARSAAWPRPPEKMNPTPPLAERQIHLTPRELTDIINRAALRGAQEALRAFDSKRSTVAQLSDSEPSEGLSEKVDVAPRPQRGRKKAEDQDS